MEVALRHAVSPIYPHGEELDPSACATCHWASPEFYKHLGLVEARRLDLIWAGRETEVYDELQSRAEVTRESMPGYVKRMLTPRAPSQYPGECLRWPVFR
jgi:hypothetical protein